MPALKVDVETLRGLEPIRAFSETRLQELAALCVVESFPSGQDPFRARGMAGEVAYLVRGELALSYANGGSVVVVGGGAEARHPLGKRGGMFSSAKAITEIQIVRIDDDLL